MTGENPGVWGIVSIFNGKIPDCFRWGGVRGMFREGGLRYFGWWGRRVQKDRCLKQEKIYLMMRSI